MRDREGHQGAAGEIQGLDQRRLNCCRQFGSNLVDALFDVVLGLLEVGADLELDDSGRGAKCDGRLKRLDVRQARDRVLDAA